ncbi:uncharacterized protein cubi_02526 [Cryptosporidium ubiquitum]|uniref:Vacuolar protein sorting-associated protein 54 C-terminal domain-containing protein n=1 Tax=Cryptosporidium ubiquitum TaxID=857276 RepID=A0A1J4MGD3_9CRYT|nr:uncharacterized protein cubi_02526 [Cryptosporidium ubiquitum]OII73314.1 hypothetical protein cubi_02526 [Cryptosporidium ubiquitum]
MDIFKNKIKGIQVTNLFNGPLDDIKQNIIDKVNTIGFEKNSIYESKDYHLDDECQHVIDNYLLENGELIKEFLTGNDLSSGDCSQHKLIVSETSGFSSNNILKQPISIDSIFEEAVFRKKQVDLKLYSQLNEMSQPFFSTLDQFEQIKANVAEIVSFLGGNSDSDGYCKDINACSEEFKSLNKILLYLHKRKRVCSIIDRLEKLDKLKFVQSDVQLLLNEKEYDKAIKMIDESVEILGTEMKGVKAVNTLSVQLYEMQSVIEKLVCQDFIHFILSWLSFGEIPTKAEISYSKLIQYDSQFEQLLQFFRNIESVRDTESFKISVFQKFQKLCLFLYNEDNTKFSSIFNINLVMNPIVALIKKERINLAIDDLEIHLNNFIDEKNQNLMDNLKRDLALLETNSNSKIICSNSKFNHQSLELILNYNILNIFYKLIFVFSIIIHSNRYLQENFESQNSETANKTLKHIYLPIIQLLEQILIRIFSKLLISNDNENNEINPSKDTYKHSSQYYIVFLKYIIIVTKLQNHFNEQMTSTCNKSYVASNSKTINFFGKAAVDIRLSLYNYYKTVFENELMKNFWINLSVIIDNEKWEKKDLYLKYKQTFKLFITGELGKEESIGIQNYFVSYDKYELNLPECCLRCIEFTSNMFVFIQKVPIISYLGFTLVFKFILNYCKKCFENIMNGDSVNRKLIEKITAYNMFLCAQNTYFWVISLEKIVNYQFRILEKEYITDEKFVNDNINLLNDENNLDVLIGVKLPIDYLNNIKMELKRILDQLEELMELSLKKISDIIIDRFKNCILNWIKNNIIEKDLYQEKNDLNKHKVDVNMNNFIRDFSNLEKTMRKYLKIDFLIWRIIERIETECLNTWKNFLLTENKKMLIGSKKLNYSNLLFDLFYFHVEITTKILYGEDEANLEKKKNLSISLLDTLFEHFQMNFSKFDEKKIFQIKETFSFIRNKLNT